MSGCGHGPEWQGQILRGNFDCLPRPPHCVAHRLPLGICDECGSTVQLGAWAEGLSQESLRAAIAGVIGGKRFYALPERDAILTEAMRRLA